MSESKEGGYRSRIQTNTRRVAIWNGAWVMATALMAFGPRFLWNRASVLTLLGVGLDFAVGVGMVLSTKRYVMELDDLQRRVYLNALGITVGVILIAAIPYSVMQMYNVISFQADVSHLVGLMSLTFVVSIVSGSVRYR